MPEFLLEVGCEEMPASWLPRLGEQLSRDFVVRALEFRLLPELTLKQAEERRPPAYWTPRRLALRVEVPPAQIPMSRPVWGPSTQLGRESKAAIGFATKQKVRPEELREGIKAGAAKHFFVEQRDPAAPTVTVLPQLIATLLRDLSFPKRMSWDAWLDDGKGSFPFGRPIRWLVALLDGEVVPFVIYEMRHGAKGEPIVTSGNATRGHRFLPRGSAGQPIPVRSFRELQETLRAHFVLLDPREREARITEALAAQARGGEIADGHGLKSEWRDLVEYPTVVVGKIPAEFLTLPAEVLQTVLVHHQKYIPLAQPGRVASRFAAVINADDAAAAEIVRGMERVVVARLRDAAFFFAEDMKRPLADRVADLAGITFHQKLGTYREKTDRMVRLVDAMGAEMGLLTKPEHQAAREAALLAKADLTTLMVRELPELQGVMGGIYLRAQGNPWENVIGAVQWHYHPTSIEEGSPPARVLAGGDATVFGAVSIADKLDTLAGYFGLGLAPTGSSDPYGLRRAAQGAVRVLLDFWAADVAEKRPSLRRLIAAAVGGYAKAPPRPAEESRLELEAFLLERLRYVLAARGFPADEVEAALGALEPDALDDPHECWLRLHALHKVRSEAQEDFAHLAVAFKRAKNILGQGQAAAVDPRLFEAPAERELHAAVGRLSAQNGDYESSLRSLASLRAPVDRFFDDVLVMAEDPKVRANRLGLLSQALALFYRIADISKLGG